MNVYKVLINSIVYEPAGSMPNSLHIVSRTQFHNWRPFPDLWSSDAGASSEEITGQKFDKGHSNRETLTPSVIIIIIIIIIIIKGRSQAKAHEAWEWEVDKAPW